VSNTGGRKTADAEAVRVTVPVGVTVQQGEFALVGGWFGLNETAPKTDLATAQDISLTISDDATYETDQILATDAFNMGDVVYFDPTARLLTTTSAEAIAVIATVDAINPATVLAMANIVKAKLNAIRTAYGLAVVATVDAVDAATAMALTNILKASTNEVLADRGMPVIATVDAVDPATTMALINQIKASVNTLLGAGQGLASTAK